MEKVNQEVMMKFMNNYACEIILGLLYMNYNDVIKEGDGERVVLIWKYLLPIFTGGIMLSKHF
jgi:hypothetical protein